MEEITPATSMGDTEVSDSTPPHLFSTQFENAKPSSNTGLNSFEDHAVHNGRGSPVGSNTSPWATSRFELPSSPPQTFQSTAGHDATASFKLSSSSSPSSDSPGRSPRPTESQLNSQKTWISRVQARTDELRRLFQLDPSEPFIDDYMCALRKKVLLQGRLFAFEYHLCFYSSLFGYHKVKTIPFDAIVDISKKKNVGFPNSIQVQWNSPSGTKKEFFTSFLSREDAYRLILGQWAQVSEKGREKAATELTPGTESDGETLGQAPRAPGGLSKRWSLWAKGATSSSVTHGVGDDGDRTSMVDDNEEDEDEEEDGEEEEERDDAGTLHTRTRKKQRRQSEMRSPSLSGGIDIVRSSSSRRVDGGDGDGGGSPSSDGIAMAGEGHHEGEPPFSWLDRQFPPPTAAAEQQQHHHHHNDHTVLSDTEGGDLDPRPSFIPGTSIQEFTQGPTCDDASVAMEFQTATEPAPPLPSTMQRVLKCNLPTTPQGFYRAFLCPSSDFFVAFHQSQGHHTIELSPWQRHYKVGPVRDLRFVTPLKGWRIGPPQALCHQTQRFRVHAHQHLVFETSQVMNDIPYGDHFRVDQRWDVTPGPEPGSCSLDVHISVPFTKSTLWKKVIEKSVTDSTLEAFNMFKELADKQLEGFKAEEALPWTSDSAASTASTTGGGGGRGLPAPTGTPVGPGHRRLPSRPSSPEEALPSTNEEWEALLGQVEPQWRGGLRVLRRMQLTGGGGGGGAGTPSSLPGGVRHRRRGSRISRGGSGSGSLDGPQGFLHTITAATTTTTSGGGGGNNNTLSGSLPFQHQQQQQHHNSSESSSLFGGSPRLPQVPERCAILNFAASKKANVGSRATGFFNKRGPVLLLCLLCVVIVSLQIGLLAVQLRNRANGGGVCCCSWEARKGLC